MLFRSDEFLNAVLADGAAAGKNLIDAKGTQLAEDAQIIFYDQTGPQNVRFVR